MTPNMERGARIIIHEWVKVRAWDKVLIVTSKEYLAEAKAMEKEASGKARSVNTLLVENKGRHVGIFFDDPPRSPLSWGAEALFHSRTIRCCAPAVNAAASAVSTRSRRIRGRY